MVTKIKAEIWEIGVCDSTLDMVHGFTHTITECFIPKYNICFNVGKDNLNVFKMGKKARYGTVMSEVTNKKIKDIELSEDFVQALEGYIETKAKIKEEAKNLLEKDNA